MISIENIDFGYPSKLALFKGLNLQIEKGRVYGLLGKNGMGKSTLLKLLSGTLKPKSGSITLDSLVPCKRDPVLLQNIYFLPEEQILPSITSL